MNVFAIVVVYNPNLTKLIKNLISIRSQVFNLVIVDNSYEKINLNDIPIKIDYFCKAFFSKKNISSTIIKD